MTHASICPPPAVVDTARRSRGRRRQPPDCFRRHDASRPSGDWLAGAGLPVARVDGKTYSLSSFKDAKVLVVIFTAVHCPTAEIYEGRIKRLVSDYKDRGVAFAVIHRTAQRRSVSTRWATPISATRSKT